eukprot:scaffold4264_cov116-Isochrysis_galbana.AAC.7
MSDVELACRGLSCTSSLQPGGSTPLPISASARAPVSAGSASSRSLWPMSRSEQEPLLRSKWTSRRAPQPARGERARARPGRLFKMCPGSLELEEVFADPAKRAAFTPVDASVIRCAIRRVAEDGQLSKMREQKRRGRQRQWCRCAISLCWSGARCPEPVGSKKRGEGKGTCRMRSRDTVRSIVRDSAARCSSVRPLHAGEVMHAAMLLVRPSELSALSSRIRLSSACGGSHGAASR